MYFLKQKYKLYASNYTFNKNQRFFLHCVGRNNMFFKYSGDVTFLHKYGHYNAYRCFFRSNDISLYAWLHINDDPFLVLDSCLLHPVFV